MTMRAPRYGLSLPNRGILFGATSVDELLEISERAVAVAGETPHGVVNDSSCRSRYR